MMYRRVAAASTLVPLAFALVALAGWITGRLRLASLRIEYIPMAPSSAVAFLVLSAALIALTFGHGTAMRNAVRAAGCLVSVVGFIEVVEFFAGVTVLKWEEALILEAGTFDVVPLARMSPLTSASLAMVGLALGCLTSTRSAVRDLAGVLGSLILLMGSTVALGYAYGAPVLYGGLVIPMALTTGFAFMGTGVALVALAGPTSLPLRPFSGGAIRALLAETERKREEAQRERLAALVEASPDFIAYADPKTMHINYINQGGRKMCGIGADEDVGKLTISDLYPARMNRPVAEAVLPAVVRDGLWEGDGVFLRRDGREVPVSMTLLAHRGADGEVDFFYTVSRDISERKRAEEEIRQAAQRSAQAEQEFRTLFAANPLPMWIYNLTTLQFLEVNDAAVYCYGYKREEFLAMTIKDIRPPEDVEGLLANVGQPRKMLQAGNWRHRLKSGQIVDVDITSHTITFAGQPAALVVAQDVTERKRAVDALRTAEERTRFALQSANVGIWDMDYTTGVLQWSETLESHYGLQPGTFGGTFEAFVERVHPDDRAALLETIGKAITAGTDFSIQNRSIWPDGTVRWLNGSGRVLLGEQGQPVRAVGISLDVTERHTLEDQYRQAQKMEAVGRLAGGVAHDFNNVLTVILGFCELLLADRDPGDPAQADIAEIQKAGVRAAGLTRQLLAFSRKQIIEPTLLDLNQIATDMRAMLGRLIGEDVKVVLRLHAGLALVKADRGQVEQIIMNLAVNARDAMPKGGTLTIETANVELDEQYAKTHLAVKPGPYVGLTVTDTGTGMTQAVQARLFEPFFTTKGPGKGTGLGLATVYGIVQRSGGSVGVYSEVGKGTAFKVYFPRADAAEKVAETPAPVVLQSAGSQTVLVVEDEQGVRDLAKRLLQRLGYTVLIAADAAEARRLFDEHPTIDILLTDVVMPGASGPELTRQLIDQRPALKVIYMSGYTEDAIVQHGVLKPGIAFLNKPFTSHTLGEKVRQVLER